MNDNKDIKFTGEPVKFDGVEGSRDPKVGKGRFDLIPEEVYHPLFTAITTSTSSEYKHFTNIEPTNIIHEIAEENFIDAIIKMTLYHYVGTKPAMRTKSGAILLPTEMIFDNHYNPLWKMLQDLAIHFQKGAEHYGERNCQKGIPLWSFKDSALRHATQVFEGKTDEPHAISVIWNCWMAEWTKIHEKCTVDRSEERKIREEYLDPKRMMKEMLDKINDDACNNNFAATIDAQKEFMKSLKKYGNSIKKVIITAEQKKPEPEKKEITSEERRTIEREVLNNIPRMLSAIPTTELLTEVNARISGMVGSNFDKGFSEWREQLIILNNSFLHAAQVLEQKASEDKNNEQ